MQLYDPGVRVFDAVIRELDGVLQIVHEHTSAPIGFEDAKAILQREQM